MIIYDVAQVRRQAPLHVQIELSKAPWPEFNGTKRPGSPEVRIGGAIVRVFRDASLVSVGDRVWFPIWICQRGDEPTGPAYLYEEDLRRKRYIEAYLHGDPPACELVGYECLLLEAPSLEPRLQEGA